MLDAPSPATDRTDTGLGLRYRLLLGLARVTVFFERLWPLAWPVVAVAGLFLAVALLDVLPMLPHWLHGLVLVAFAAAFALMLRRAWETVPGSAAPPPVTAWKTTAASITARLPPLMISC